MKANAKYLDCSIIVYNCNFTLGRVSLLLSYIDRISCKVSSIAEKTKTPSVSTYTPTKTSEYACGRTPRATFTMYSASAALSRYDHAGTQRHRIQETFLSRIRCRSDLAMLFPASRPPDFFMPFRDNGKVPVLFRSARFASSQPLRRLISINCDGDAAVDERRFARRGTQLRASIFFGDIRILYCGSNEVNVSRVRTCKRICNGLSNARFWRK